jgi:hypothetical protein
MSDYLGKMEISSEETKTLVDQLASYYNVDLTVMLGAVGVDPD